MVKRVDFLCMGGDFKSLPPTVVWTSESTLLVLTQVLKSILYYNKPTWV